MSYIWSGFFAGGMSPSSVIVIRGVRGLSFKRGIALRSTGGNLGDVIRVGDSDVVRFSIAPPFPAIQTLSPPRKTIACITFEVMFDSCAHV